MSKVVVFSDNVQNVFNEMDITHEQIKNLMFDQRTSFVSSR